MPASREFASGNRKLVEGTGGSTLFSGVNWLGDSVMTMPAIQEFKRRNPACPTAMLSKPSLTALWKMNPHIDTVIELHPGPTGAASAALAVRRAGFERAYVLTQSFRSALVPFLARVPSRTGMPGHNRDWMLTAVVRPVETETRRHQMFEYFDLLGIGGPAMPDTQSIVIPSGVLAACRQKLAELLPAGHGRPIVGILPGAAHGSAKRWPVDFFKQVTEQLVNHHGCRAIVFGSENEAHACSLITAGITESAVDLSGKTSIPELAAMLQQCTVVIANDSGGMHLAAIVNTPVVAIFGLTDPAKTGPLGLGHRIIAADRTDRSRDLEPDSQVAKEALLSVRPETVLAAALDILENREQRHVK